MKLVRFLRVWHKKETCVRRGKKILRVHIAAGQQLVGADPHVQCDDAFEIEKFVVQTFSRHCDRVRVGTLGPFSQSRSSVATEWTKISEPVIWGLEITSDSKMLFFRTNPFVVSHDAL